MCTEEYKTLRANCLAFSQHKRWLHQAWEDSWSLQCSFTNPAVLPLACVHVLNITGARVEYHGCQGHVFAHPTVHALSA